ncbi:unnamed protein product [Closterium sp. NIES-54]
MSRGQGLHQPVFGPGPLALRQSFVSGAALRLSATPLLTSSRLAPSLVSSWSSGPPPRFLATTPPPTTIPPLDPPPRGPAPSGVSHATPLPSVAHSEGVGVGGTGACGASPEGVGAEDVGARGCSFWEHSRGARAGGASLEETGAGGTRLELELQQKEQQQQHQQQLPPLYPLSPPVSGFRALGLPFPPPDASLSPTAYGPMFPPTHSPPSGLVFGCFLSSSVTVVSSCCPAQLLSCSCTSLISFQRPPNGLTSFESLMFSALVGSPDESSLIASISTPITDYYRATRRVVTRVLASLVTDRRASSSFISALNATVTDFAATRHLDYATRMVPAHPLSARIGSALGYDHSETTSYTAFLKGRLHGEIWMRRSPGINYHFPSSDPMERRPVYGLCQAPHEWHDTLRTTLATLGFSSSYAEIVGCLMYYMTCTRLDLAFPLGVLSRFDATRRHRLVHWSAPVRVAKYLVTTPGMWLVLGGTQPIVLTEHCNSSYAHDVETQRSTQGYCFNLGTGACLRWLTFFLTDLGERPRSAPTFYADSKAMILLCQEPQLESKVKHIDVRYFLLRELQRRGHARLDFVASAANTAYIFTKALALGPRPLGPLTATAATVAPAYCATMALLRVLAFDHEGRLALYDAVVARYSSLATATLGRLLLPYLFPELCAFATVEDLVSHLRTSNARYRAAVPAEFLHKNQPSMFITLYFIVTCLPDSLRSVTDHFLSLDPTSLTADLLEQHLLAAQTTTVAVGAACGTPRPPFFEGAEGACYRCVPPDPGIAAAALGASESGTLPGTVPAQALHTFTLDSGASACFFRDSTTLTPLSILVPVQLADPSGGPDVARFSTVLPCPAVPSGSLSGLHLPSFSANLVSTTALHDAMVTTTTLGGQRVTICTSTRTGHHLAAFTCRPGSSLYTLATEPPQVAASAQTLSAAAAWFVRRARLWSGATRAGGAGGAAGAGVTGAIAITGPGGARTRGTRAAGSGGVEGAGAGDPKESGATGAGGSGAGGIGAAGAGFGGTGTGDIGVGGPGVRGAGAGGARAVDPGGVVRPRPYFVPLLQQLVCTARRVPRSRPPPVPGTHAMTLRPSSIPLCVPLPSPPEFSLPEVPDPESDRTRATSPTVSCLLATAVTDPSFESAAASALVAELLDFATAYHLDYTTALVAESASASPASVGGECALGTDVFEDKKEDFECLAAAVPRFASTLLAPEGDPDAPDIPTPRSYAEAITGTYVDEVPAPGANIVDGMWIFRVKWPPGSPPAFKARYVARGFSQRQGVDYFHTFSPTPKMTTLGVLLHVAAQRDYELHSLDFSTDFLQGSLHEEIWLRRPPGFTVSFPAGLHLRLLGLLLLLLTRRCFYVLVYVDDLVFATADIEALTLVNLELQKRHTCTHLGELRSYLGLQITRDRARCTITLTLSHMVHQVLQRFGFQFSSPQLTPLSTSHLLSAPPSDESVEPSGSYPELVGCFMYLMTCTRPHLAYPLSLLACYVAPGRHQKVHWDDAKKVLRYLCSTSGMGLVLGGRGPVVLTGHADASCVDDSATQGS